MGNGLIKPSDDALKDPEQALLIVMRLYDAVVELQKAAAAPSPERQAHAAGKTKVVVIRGATVTLPGSLATFTADVYVDGVPT